MLRIIARFLTSFIQRSWSIQWLAAKQAQITTQRNICMSWLWLCSHCCRKAAVSLFRPWAQHWISFTSNVLSHSFLKTLLWDVRSNCCKKKKNTLAFSAALSLREEDSCYCLPHLPFFFYVSNIFCNSATSLWHFTKSSLCDFSSLYSPLNI